MAGYRVTWCCEYYIRAVEVPGHGPESELPAPLPMHLTAASFLSWSRKGRVSMGGSPTTHHPINPLIAPPKREFHPCTEYIIEPIIYGIRGL